MNITHYSRERLYNTFKAWEVPQDFADPMAAKEETWLALKGEEELV